MLTDASFKEGEGDTFDDYRYANHKQLRLVDLVSCELVIEQDFRLGKGGILWDAAYLLSKHLLELDLVGKKILELGAGCGLCSVVAAAAGAQVWATDIPPALTLTHKNYELNSGVCSNMTVAKLDWASEADRLSVTTEFDVILMSDLFYILELAPSLTATLLHFTRPQTLVLLTFKYRMDETRDAYLESLSQYFTIHYKPEKLATFTHNSALHLAELRLRESQVS